jgi:hypothetical protein
VVKDRGPAGRHKKVAMGLLRPNRAAHPHA